MTNYNDGKWHNWSGGECPVHPETMVAAIWRGDETGFEESSVYGIVRKAKDFQGVCWGHAYPIGSSDIVVFRVIKEHKEPREFWISTETGKAYNSLPSFRTLVGKYEDFIHVKEVLK